MCSPGGKPTRAFTPATPNADVALGGTIYQCPLETWTIEVAATNPEQCCKCRQLTTAVQTSCLQCLPTTSCAIYDMCLCMKSLQYQTHHSLADFVTVCCLDAAVTPPGHFTNATSTYLCPAGTYRADWLPAAQAGECLACGEGVKTVATDRVSKYDTVSYAETKVPITTSSDDCCKSPSTAPSVYLWCLLAHGMSLGAWDHAGWRFCPLSCCGPDHILWCYTICASGWSG